MLAKNFSLVLLQTEIRATEIDGENMLKGREKNGTGNCELWPIRKGKNWRKYNKGQIRKRESTGLQT
jgi:hypothetical protein